MSGERGALLEAAVVLADETDRLPFDSRAAYVYRPLRYAWEGYAAYLRKYGASRKRVLFIGMNPGPWGMAQTGVPFGEIGAVRDWMKLRANIEQPERMHPLRPVTGFACPRSEVSGRRLWGLFRERFGTPEAFFRDHLVLNYCPLYFLLSSGANLAPDKLSRKHLPPLLAACDRHLRVAAAATQVEWVLGIGAFAEARVRSALDGMRLRTGRLLHPSPASPAANRGWASAAMLQLFDLGVWTR